MNVIIFSKHDGVDLTRFSRNWARKLILYVEQNTSFFKAIYHIGEELRITEFQEFSEWKGQICEMKYCHECRGNIKIDSTYE